MSDDFVGFFLCFSSSRSFFSSIFIHIHFAAGHLHGTIKTPCLCWLTFPLYPIFLCKFWLNTDEMGRKKTHARAFAHSQQSNWRPKIKRYIMNTWLVLKFDLEMGRTTNEVQKYKVSREKKIMFFFLSLSAVWRSFLQFFSFCFAFFSFLMEYAQ